MHRTPECHCPTCQKKITAATMQGGDAAPAPGDLSMCWGCTEFLVFHTNMTLRRMSLAEFDALDPETQVMLHDMRKMRLTNAVRAWRGPGGKVEIRKLGEAFWYWLSPDSPFGPVVAGMICAVLLVGLLSLGVWLCAS